MRGRERGGRRGREDEKGASPSKNTVGLETKSPPSEVSAAFSARSLPAPPPPPLLALNFYCVFFFFSLSLSPLFLFLSFLSRRTIFSPGIPGDQNQRPGGSIPLGTAFILFQMKTLGLFFFLFGQKRHKSGQLALAPRRSSRSNFAPVFFAHSSTQVRNVTVHSVDGCETRRTQSPFDEIYMAPRCFWIAVRGFPAPARGARPGPCSQPAASSRQT